LESQTSGQFKRLRYRTRYIAEERRHLSPMA
jgi:hypothetical protein